MATGKFPNKSGPIEGIRPNVTERTRAVALSEADKLRKQTILTEFMLFLAEEQQNNEIRNETSAGSRGKDEEQEDEGDFCHSGDVVEGRFHVITKLRQGGFGQIFKAIDATMRIEVALKFEELEENRPSMETHVLARYQGHVHCPVMYAKAVYPDCSFVAMQLLGRNISDARRNCTLTPPRLSIGSTCRVIIQCLEAIQALHDIGYLHRDIKPSNFCVGNEQRTQNIIYMIDFGLARYYLTKEGTVRPQREIVGFRGTLKYASLTAHQTKDIARRDDMWSLFYSLYELITGDLPWKSSNDRELVGLMKTNHKPETMCQQLPLEIAEFVRLIRCLDYADKPAYVSMNNCFQRLIQRSGGKLIDTFDWQVSSCTSFVHLSPSHK